MAIGKRRWYIIVCYLAHDDTLTIGSVVAAHKGLTQGSKLLVTGDLNSNLDDPEGD